MKQNWKKRLPWIGLALGTGILGALLCRQGIASYSENVLKPPLTPPVLIFPVVWTVLYILMGWSAGDIADCSRGRQRSRGLNLFAAQLTVNFFWSLLFFNAEAYGFSLAWLLLLWILILGMMLAFYRLKPLAAWLQVPYLLWVSFAGYLNWGVWQLNSGL